MEHVVFFPDPNEAPAFRRVSSLDEAVRLVEHLRNVEGVAEFSVHALTEVPLSLRTYYRVEVPAAVPTGVHSAPAIEPISVSPALAMAAVSAELAESAASAESAVSAELAESAASAPLDEHASTPIEAVDDRDAVPSFTEDQPFVSVSPGPDSPAGQAPERNRGLGFFA